jgi:class 3 adenylate cyclase
VSADPITTALCAELHQRAARGLAKYGVSVSDNPLTPREWLQHAKEEALDLATYLERLIRIEGGRADAEPAEYPPIRVRIRLASGDVVVRDVATVAEAVAELPWPLAVSWEVEGAQGAFW